MKKKILIIDDSETILKDISKILTDAGYIVLTQNKALGSSKVIMLQEPSLVLLDINMPSFSGTELLQTLRESMPKLPPILLFSDLDKKELQRIAQEKKADGYLSKSDRNQLLATVQAMIKQ